MKKTIAYSSMVIIGTGIQRLVMSSDDDEQVASTNWTEDSDRFLLPPPLTLYHKDSLFSHPPSHFSLCTVAVGWTVLLHTLWFSCLLWFKVCSVFYDRDWHILWKVFLVKISIFKEKKILSNNRLELVPLELDSQGSLRQNNMNHYIVICKPHSYKSM